MVWLIGVISLIHNPTCDTTFINVQVRFTLIEAFKLPRTQTQTQQSEKNHIEKGKKKVISKEGEWTIRYKHGPLKLTIQKLLSSRILATLI